MKSSLKTTNFILVGLFVLAFGATLFAKTHDDCASELTVHPHVDMKSRAVIPVQAKAIPADWQKRAELDIKTEEPNKENIFMLENIIENYPGDGVDIREKAVDLLADYAKFCPFAWAELERLAQTSEHVVLANYMLLKILKLHGARLE